MARSSRPSKRISPRKPNKRKRSGAGVAKARRLQSAHLKRRQSHVSSRARRKQARRDRRR